MLRRPAVPRLRGQCIASTFSRRRCSGQRRSRAARAKLTGTVAATTSANLSNGGTGERDAIRPDRMHEPQRAAGEADYSLQPAGAGGKLAPPLSLKGQHATDEHARVLRQVNNLAGTNPNRTTPQ